MSTWVSLNAGGYIAAEEFLGKSVTRTISAIEQLDFEKDDGGHEKRGVVSFKETDRKWVLNKTNCQLLAAIWPRREDSIGRKVTLASELVPFGKEKVPGIRVTGSPELTSSIAAIVKLPRHKARTVTLTPTGRTGSVSPPSTEPVPATPASTSGPLTLRCTGCGATIPASVDATADDLVGISCGECGADMEVAS